MYDVVIVGAGPVGLACGLQAQREGLRALLIEKGALVNSFVGYPHNMEFFSTPELMEIGGYPFPTQGYKPTREEGLEYYRRVALAAGLDVRLYERVERLQGQRGAFEVVTSRGRHAARHVVVATGFFDVPNRLGVPGEELPKVAHYFREPFAYAGQRVAVVGGKNSAAKAALLCYRHGAAVTLIHRGPALAESVKYWIRPDLENRIREGSIRALFESTVVAIRPDAVDVATPGGPLSLPNDWVLALIGYRPDYALLEALGIATGDDAARTPVHDPETFETNRPGVYLAGTVCGGLRTSRWFIENGRFHAERIMQHIAHGTRNPERLEDRHWVTAE